MVDDIQTTAYTLCRRGVEFLGDAHHLVVVHVRLIQFDRGELGIVLGVHTLVAELTTDFVNFFKSADYATFEVQLGCDTHIHIDIEGVVVRDERTCVRTACKRVENGGFNLDKSFFVKHFTYCGNDFATLDKHVFDFGICDKVNVALTEAQFGITESVEFFGKRKQGF